MDLVSTFNGQEQRRISVQNKWDLVRKSRKTAMGDGWGQYVEGERAELKAVGAYQLDEGGWALYLGGGRYLACEEVP